MTIGLHLSSIPDPERPERGVAAVYHICVSGKGTLNQNEANRTEGIA